MTRDQPDVKHNQRLLTAAVELLERLVTDAITHHRHGHVGVQVNFRDGALSSIHQQGEIVHR